MSVWTGLLWLVGTLEVLAVVLLAGARPTRNWCRQDRLSAANLLLNVVTFGGAVIGVLIAYNAFTETRRQADEAKRQGDVSDDRTKIDQRGQLVADKWFVGNFGMAGTPIASFVLCNPGRTPAYIIGGTYEASIGLDLPKEFPNGPHQLRTLPGIIRQGQGSESPIVITENLPSVDTESIDGEEQFYYLRIIRVYQDIFQTRYEMRATAKYGKFVDANGNKVNGFQFPEEPSSNDDILKSKVSVDDRKYNSHRRLRD